MDTLAYQVVYDATRASAPGWGLVPWGVVAAVAGAAVLWRAVRGGGGSVAARAAGTTLVIFGLGWAVVVGGGLWAQHALLGAALRGGRHTVVEGIVYDRPPSGRGTSWVVESGARAHWYRYDASPFAVGYRRRGPGDGGLRDGARVRLADVGGRLARVEVVTGR